MGEDMPYNNREMLIQAKIDRHKILKLNSILSLLGITKKRMLEHSIDRFIEEHTKNPTPTSRWLTNMWI